jgi:hypothetical protein
MRGDKQFLETPFYGVHQITWHLGPYRERETDQTPHVADGPHGDLPEAQHPMTDDACLHV